MEYEEKIRKNLWREIRYLAEITGFPLSIEIDINTSIDKLEEIYEDLVNREKLIYSNYGTTDITRIVDPTLLMKRFPSGYSINK